MEPTMKITDAVLRLLGDGPLTAHDMARMINTQLRFNGVCVRQATPITAAQVYAAMSGLRSKTSVQRTFIEPVNGKLGMHNAYALTGYGETRLRALTGLTQPVVDAAPAPPVYDHPAHYGGADDPFEAIKVIEAWGLGFNLGNTLKYISRAEKKGAPLIDLQKARWYLDREIASREQNA